jgi:hypothetical protein
MSEKKVYRLSLHNKWRGGRGGAIFFICGLFLIARSACLQEETCEISGGTARPQRRTVPQYIEEKKV